MKFLFKPDVTYVWWAVDLANEVNDAYDSNVHTLLSNTNQYTLSGIGGKYLLVEATHQDGLGNTHVNRLNLGQIMPSVTAERPTDTWPSELDLGTDYVKVGDTLTANPLVRAGETTPPNIEYCFINGMTGIVLQACSTTNTYTVQNAEDGATIEVLAKFSDASDTNIAEQRISKVLLPTSTSLDLSYPRFDITSPNNSQTVSVNPPTRFDGSGANLQWWKKTANGSYEAINGENSATYTPDMDDVGDQLYLVATMTDSNDGREYVLTTPLTDPVNSDLIDIYRANLTLYYALPLHPDDAISLLRLDAFTQLNANLPPNVTLSVAWQTSTNGTTWTSLPSTAQFVPATNLSANQQYRLHVNATQSVTNENLDVYSDISPVVANASSVNLDAFVTLKNAVQADLPLRINAGLLNADGATQYFTHTELDWYEADGATLTNVRTPLASNASSYTPNSGQIGNLLLLHLKYYEDATLLSESWLETPTVESPAYTTDMATLHENAIPAFIFPNEPTDYSQLTLDKSAQRLLNDPTNVSVNYQWQGGTPLTGFTDITGETSPSLQLSGTQANQQIRLKITFTDLNNDTLALFTAPTYVVQADPNQHRFTPRIQLNNTNELSLTDASMNALNRVIQANATNNVTYEWRRLPAHFAHFDTNGQTTSTSDTVSLGNNASADNNARHQLRISLDGNEPLDLYSVISPIWQQNTADDQVTLQRYRYQDQVQVYNGTVPAQLGQTLIANTYSDNPLNDFPTPVNYQWQRQTGGIWNDIPSANNPEYQVVADDVSAGNVRVQITPTDSQGNLLPHLSQARSLQNTSLANFDVNIHPYSASMTVGQSLYVTHRDLGNNENVDIEWYRLNEPSWDNSTRIPNVSGNNYTVTTDDVGYFIGAKVSIEESGTTLSAHSAVVGEVVSHTTGMSMLNAQILPSYPYQNSSLNHQITLFKANVLDEPSIKSVMWIGFY